jgi:hypothetical protein
VGSPIKEDLAKTGHTFRENHEQRATDTKYAAMTNRYSIEPPAGI